MSHILALFAILFIDMVTIRKFFSLGGREIINSQEYIPSANPKSGIYGIISVVLKNIYIITGLILLIMIFVGGLGMILNAGNTDKQKQSSKTLSSAVAGFFIIFASYWIIKLIELIFGIQIFTLT